jgi:hypothetical protein
MRRIVCREFGPPEHLRLEVVPDPKPGPGEVLGPGAFQNGATDSAADRALTRSPASSRALSSVSAHDGDASARAAKACCRGRTTTAARRYQRSIVLP